MILLLAPLPAQEATSLASNQSDGVTLIRDLFEGSGSLPSSKPAEDIDGNGWKIPVGAPGPSRDQGHLVSGGAESYATIGLPPLSPHGELTITASLLLRAGPALMLGFTDDFQHAKPDTAGPWLRIDGQGRLSIQQKLNTPLSEATIAPGPGQVALRIRYRLWDQAVDVSVDGKDLLRAAIKTPPSSPYRFFSLAYEATEASSGPALDALQINYLPLARPEPKSAHRKLLVQDTTLAGITKAITEANAASGPDNLIEVSIPSAHYHFSPDATVKEHLFRLFGLHDLIINWNHSTITIHDPALGLHNLSAAKNVTVANIASVDFPEDNLPFTQGTVRAIDPASHSFDLEIDPGYPLPTHDFFRHARQEESWGQLIDPESPGRRPAGAALEYWIKDVQAVAQRTFRYTLKTPPAGFKVGSRFADCPRTGNPLFRIFDAQNVRLENITGHSSAHFWAMVYGSSLSCQRVQVLLKPGRLMTSNGDIITGTGNRLWMEHCRFEGNADDICHQFRAEAAFISHCLFRNNRRFGLWLNTAQFAVVQNCQFDGLGSYALTGMKEPGMNEEIAFASRNVLCVGNQFQNLNTEAIFLHSSHSQEDSSPHWNTYWRLVDNQTSAPIRIRNATNIRCVGNTSAAGTPAKIEVDPSRSAAIVVVDREGNSSPSSGTR